MSSNKKRKLNIGQGTQSKLFVEDEKWRWKMEDGR